MRQLTASEASNDEMERQRFENWFGKLSIPELLKSNQEMDGFMNPIVSIAWKSWQAALKSKQG